jgi:hypothetical protein
MLVMRQEKFTACMEVLRGLDEKKVNDLHAKLDEIVCGKEEIQTMLAAVACVVAGNLPPDDTEVGAFLIDLLVVSIMSVAKGQGMDVGRVVLSRGSDG